MSGAVTKRSIKSSQEGFTLIELLVSLSLLALMMAAVPALVRMTGKSMQVADDLTRSHADVQALTAIADKVADARPLMAVDDDGAKHIQFWGSETSVHFIAPGNVGVSGGLVVYDLGQIQGRSGTPMLALSRTVVRSSKDDDHDTAADIRIPMPETRRLAIRYFGTLDKDEAAVWSDHWEQTGSLPQLIEISTFSARRPSLSIRTVTVALRHYVPPDARNRR